MKAKSSKLVPVVVERQIGSVPLVFIANGGGAHVEGRTLDEVRTAARVALRRQRREPDLQLVG